MSLYYKIWVDAISKIKENPLRKEDWKWFVQIFIGMAMAVDFSFIMAILQRNIFNYNFYDINFDFFLNNFLNSVASFLILFFFPPAIINYYLIFHRNKYEQLTKRYKSYNGKLFTIYFLIALFVPLLVLLIAFFISRN